MVFRAVIHARGMLRDFGKRKNTRAAFLSPISAFYPHFSVLSPFQRFIPISAFYPPFSFRFQFPFPPFSFSVLSDPFTNDAPSIFVQGNKKRIFFFSIN